MSMVEQSLGQLARSIPGATQVFHEYELDFCCGGKKSLGEAAAQRSLDPTQIEARLIALSRNPPHERTGARHRPPNSSTTSWRDITTCTASSCPN